MPALRQEASEWRLSIANMEGIEMEMVSKE